jgi:hypothetical protein
MTGSLARDILGDVSVSTGGAWSVSLLLEAVGTSELAGSRGA